MKGREEMKERMAKLRAMRGGGIGRKLEKTFKPLASKKQLTFMRQLEDTQSKTY